MVECGVAIRDDRIDSLAKPQAAYPNALEQQERPRLLPNGMHLPDSACTAGQPPDPEMQLECR